MSHVNCYTNYLKHHGVKGQKWGVRRYQNSDGTLTEAGKKRQLKKAKRLLLSYKDSVVENATYVNQYDRVIRRIDKKADKASTKNQTEKYEKLKYENQMHKDIQKQLRTRAELDMRSAKALVEKMKREYGDKKIKDIDEEKLMAGRSLLINGLMQTAYVVEPRRHIDSEGNKHKIYRPVRRTTIYV